MMTCIDDVRTAKELNAFCFVRSHENRMQLALLSLGMKRHYLQRQQQKQENTRACFFSTSRIPKYIEKLFARRTLLRARNYKTSGCDQEESIQLNDNHLLLNVFNGLSGDANRTRLTNDQR